MSTITTSTDTPINVFDFAAIRLPPDFEREAGVRKQLTLVPVRKPRRQEWFRAHPDPECRARVATIAFKENEEAREETFLVAPAVALTLGDEITYTTLYLCINRQGHVFLWPCRDPKAEDRRGDIAATTRIEAAEAAMTRYVRVQWKSPAYEMSFRDETIVDAAPLWPDKPFAELVELAFFKSGMYIADPNHQVIKILQGRN
jgi:hypothetical protein